MSRGESARGSIARPAGEERGVGARFTAADVAAAFGVDEAAVRRAIAEDSGSPAGAPIDSRRAQRLAEVLLRDEPLDGREAALMRLGAFTPRRDAEWGLGDAPEGEESDQLAARADVSPKDLASSRSSHDPATQPAEPA
jgi:hypothetical protein